MNALNEFEAMIEACIANHAEIMQHGSSEMKTASRLLLYALGEEVRRRGRGATVAANDDG